MTERNRKDFYNLHTPPPSTYPAISVIIPMYNAENYIGECLDSILVQTFQNFEVIVVDDCSVDNSVEVVKSYAPKFSGRLKLAKTLKNSGGGAIPRNVGLPLTRGEYISFLDADDAFTYTALEELYTIAKNFDVDVVGCENYYSIPDELWHDTEFRDKLKPSARPGIKFVKEPTFLTNNIFERLNLCIRRRFLWNVWSKLIRRDFIFSNSFVFADTIIEDVVFLICLLCTAEKYVLVPNVVNYYRERQESISHNTAHDEKFFRKYVKAFVAAFRYLDKFLDDREMFCQNAHLKYFIFEICWSELLYGYIFRLYDQNPTYAFDEILCEELDKEDNLALAAFTFSEGTSYRLRFIKAQRRIAELENALKKRE